MASENLAFLVLVVNNLYNDEFNFQVEGENALILCNRCGDLLSFYLPFYEEPIKEFQALADSHREACAGRSN